MLLAGDPEDYERILRAFQDAHEPAIEPFLSLDTLDTLIWAGFATTRAQAIRWALDRIRARPAVLVRVMGGQAAARTGSRS